MPLSVSKRKPVAAAIFGFLVAMYGNPMPASAQSERDENQFGAWTLHCADQAEGARNCWLGQVLLRQQDNRFLAEIRLRISRDDRENPYVMLLHVPSGILLTERAAFRQHDAETDVPMRWHNCTERLCTAVRALEQEEVENLRSGLRMVVGYQRFRAPQPTVFEVSLIGVTAGLAALEAREGGN